MSEDGYKGYKVEEDEIKFKTLDGPKKSFLVSMAYGNYSPGHELEGGHEGLFQYQNFPKGAKIEFILHDVQIAHFNDKFLVVKTSLESNPFLMLRWSPHNFFLLQGDTQEGRGIVTLEYFTSGDPLSSSQGPNGPPSQGVFKLPCHLEDWTSMFLQSTGQAPQEELEGGDLKGGYQKKKSKSKPPSKRKLARKKKSVKR